MRVALHFQSDRHATIQDPLEAVGVETVLNPDSYSQFDTVICGSPGLLSDHWRFDGPVVYRLRGNLWEERGGHLARPRSWVKDKLFSRLCDGVLTPDSRLDQLLRRKTAVTRTAVVGLPIDCEAWPTVSHSGSQVRAVTLTNFDYEKKVKPLFSYATAADTWLSAHGGRWAVCGDGEHAEEFAGHARELEAVEYRGFQPARDVLAESNVMIHPSNMDIQLPNAVLEGAASGLPVLTNNAEPIIGRHVAEAVSRAGLSDSLGELSDAGEREYRGHGNREYVRENHSHEEIGAKIRAFVEGLL